MNYISMDRYNEMQERAERAEAERDALKAANADLMEWKVQDDLREVEFRALRAEHDALREVVKAADEVRLGLDCPMCDSGELRNPAKGHWDTCAFANYDAARAKVKP